MRILLTGANGFLGSRILEKLIVNNEVYITLRKDSQTNRIDSIIQKSRVKVFFVDENNTLEIENLFKNEEIELIVHCATDYGKQKDYFFKVFESNVLFPLKLLEIGIKYNLKYFINTDSYFNKDNLTYNALPNYSKTKKLFLSYLRDMGKNISIINMRLEHVYGPNDNGDKFITYLVKNMKLNEKIPLTFGHQKRDFVFVDDVAEVYNNIILNITKLPTTYFEDLEIGQGKSIHLRNFIEMLSVKIKTESILDYGAIEYRDDEIMNSFANNSLSQWAKQFDINFNFMDVDEGIEKMLSYEYNQNLSK